jgi:hypothetical protein
VEETGEGGGASKTVVTRAVSHTVAPTVSLSLTISLWTPGVQRMANAVQRGWPPHHASDMPMDTNQNRLSGGFSVRLFPSNRCACADGCQGRAECSVGCGWCGVVVAYVWETVHGSCSPQLQALTPGALLIVPYLRAALFSLGRLAGGAGFSGVPPMARSQSSFSKWLAWLAWLAV